MQYWSQIVKEYEKKLKGNDDSWGPPAPVEPLIKYVLPKPSYDIEETKSEESSK